MVNKRNTLGRGLDSLLKKNEKEITNKIFEEIDIDNIEDWNKAENSYV